MSVDIDRLRDGSIQQAAASEAGALARRALAGHGIESSMLGAVPAAARFHATLAHVLVRQTADAGVESARRTDLAGRASRTAGLGVQLVGETTVAASSAVPWSHRSAGR